MAPWCRFVASCLVVPVWRRPVWLCWCVVQPVYPIRALNETERADFCSGRNRRRELRQHPWVGCLSHESHHRGTEAEVVKAESVACRARALTRESISGPVVPAVRSRFPFPSLCLCGEKTSSRCPMRASPRDNFSNVLTIVELCSTVERRSRFGPR